MADVPRVLKAVTSSVWLIEPEKLALIADLFAMRLAGERLSREEISELISEGKSGSPANVLVTNGNGVAVQKVYGTLIPRAGMMSEFSGGTSVEALSREFDTLMADQSVHTIVLDIDSPGGNVAGIREFGDKIRAARDTKNIVAVANSDACSAAYWLGSQAGAFYATPSARVGSVGAYMMHVDESEKMKQEGVKVTYVSAGENKLDGNPYAPLSDGARERMQERINDTYGQFVEAVAAGRSTSVENVLENYGKGAVLTAKAAEAAGMVDGISTLAGVIASATGHQVATLTRNPAPVQASAEEDNMDVLTELGLGTDVEEAKTKLAVLRAAADQSEAYRTQVIELQTEVQALKEALDESKAAEHLRAVEVAILEGRLSGKVNASNEEFARDLALRDMAMFEKYLETQHNAAIPTGALEITKAKSAPRAEVARPFNAVTIPASPEQAALIGEAITRAKANNTNFSAEFKALMEER